MSFFSWFNANEAKKFGEFLAEIVIARVPDKIDRISEKNLGKKHDAMLFQLEKQISLFEDRKSLNIYKKAQLGNAFKWRLLESKFDVEYVNQLTTLVVHKLK